MVITINPKYANSSSNYYVIMMLQNLEKSKDRKFPILFAYVMHEVPS